MFLSAAARLRYAASVAVAFTLLVLLTAVAPGGSGSRDADALSAPSSEMRRPDGWEGAESAATGRCSTIERAADGRPSVVVECDGDRCTRMTIDYAGHRAVVPGMAAEVGTEEAR